MGIGGVSKARAAKAQALHCAAVRLPDPMYHFVLGCKHGAYAQNLLVYGFNVEQMLLLRAANTTQKTEGLRLRLGAKPQAVQLVRQGFATTYQGLC